MLERFICAEVAQPLETVKSHATPFDMADENSPEGASAPVAAPEAPQAAEAVAAAVAAPEAIVEAAPAPATAAEPVVEAPAEPAAAAEAPVKAAEAAPEAKPAVDAPKAEAAAAAAEPAPAPTYEDFKLPDGFQAPAEVLAPFTEFLGKRGLSQEDGQALMDMHADAIKMAGDQLLQRQIDVFAETRAGWIKDVDKQFGNRRDTAINDAKWAKHELFAKDPKAAAAFESVLEFTGVGDHPAMIDLLSRVTQRLRERPAPPIGVPTNRPASRADQRYGPTPRR